MKNRKYWVWLSLALDVATPAYQKVLSEFEYNIIKVYESSKDGLSALKLTAKQKAALLDKSLDEAEIIVDWCDNNHVGILCYDDPRFPKRLASIPNAPVVLYYIGELYPIDDMLCLAGVGTRDMTKYGHDSAYAFCHDLARSGAIIVSGMANGIDSVCHRAALDAGGKTVAVLGCRINKVYPANNRDLMVEIARKGLLITEFHPFYKTNPSNFPKRNRIISGLCQATMVFEADAGSGSLITADYAVKQGRRIYSLPGDIGNSGSNGTNQLLREGAKIAVRSSDIIDEYKYLYPELNNVNSLFDYSPRSLNLDSYIAPKRKTKKNTVTVNKKNSAVREEKELNENNIPAKRPAPDTSSLSETEKRIYEALSFEHPLSQEQIYLPGVDIGEVMSAYTMLELKGFIEALPGNKYIKI